MNDESLLVFRRPSRPTDQISAPFVQQLARYGASPGLLNRLAPVIGDERAAAVPSLDTPDAPRRSWKGRRAAELALSVVGLALVAFALFQPFGKLPGALLAAAGLCLVLIGPRLRIAQLLAAKDSEPTGAVGLPTLDPVRTVEESAEEWQRRAESASTAIIRAAARRQPLDIEQRHNGALVMRTLESWALVQWHGRPHVIGRDRYRQMLLVVPLAEIRNWLTEPESTAGSYTIPSAVVQLATELGKPSATTPAVVEALLAELLDASEAGSVAQALLRDAAADDLTAVQQMFALLIERSAKRELQAEPAFPSTSAPSEGWYPDPLDDASIRWWDGARWTRLTRPWPANPPGRVVESERRDG
ncbi:DUF2510 domain-containing protein [Kribbella speibonae]|nr:DUF2510 domain-containing protein [Kribbella speibonae]